MKKIISRSPSETEAFGEELGNHLKPGAFVALYGGMGMGKTKLVRGLARALGIEDYAGSPTFAIVNEYRTKIPFFHFDMYRITDEDDLYSVGFYDYLDGNGIIAAEWCENIEYALPAGCIKIIFEQGENPDERIITVFADEVEQCLS